jgi:hypothetical protein
VTVYANTVLPLRAGEFVRRTWPAVKDQPAVTTTIILERLLDLVNGADVFGAFAPPSIPA